MGVWGWAEWEALEREYRGGIYKERNKLGVNNMLKAEKYLVKVSRMEEDRWPQVWLREKMPSGNRQSREK